MVVSDECISQCLNVIFLTEIPRSISSVINNW